ncbi:hypothetical protein ACLIA0_06125 [Bacillaceae bacterium W0354]
MQVSLPSHNLIQELANQFSGKLLLQKELHLEEELFQKLLDHHYLKEIPGIKMYMSYYECARCFNQSNKYFGKLPKGIIYCKKCIMMGRVSELEPLFEWTGPKPTELLIEEACSWEGELTPLQQKASLAIIRAINEQSRLLIHAVCGADNDYREFNIKNSTQFQSLRCYG